MLGGNATVYKANRNPTEVEEMAVAGMDITVVVEMVAVKMVAVEADKITHIR